MNEKWKCPKCKSKNIDGSKSCTMDGITLPGWDMWCYDCKHTYHVDDEKEEA